MPKVKKGTRKFLIGKGSGAPLTIFQRSDVASPTSWIAGIKIEGNARTYHTIKDCPDESYARKEAMRLYDMKLNQNETILNGIHNVLGCAELLGTWKLQSEELNKYLKNNKREGTYVYALFPSDGSHEIEIINDIFRYVRYGKIGSTGMGKCSRTSLRNRLCGHYRSYINNQHNKSKWKPLWMDDVLMPIQEWYVSIICINPEKEDQQNSAALTMEQICINAAMVYHGATPYGNINENGNRVWVGTISPDGKPHSNRKNQSRPRPYNPHAVV